jgi:hypothetical protein
MEKDPLLISRVSRFAASFVESWLKLGQQWTGSCHLSKMTLKQVFHNVTSDATSQFL